MDTILGPALHPILPTYRGGVHQTSIQYLFRRRLIKTASLHYEKHMSQYTPTVYLSRSNITPSFATNLYRISHPFPSPLFRRGYSHLLPRFARPTCFVCSACYRCKYYSHTVRRAFWGSIGDLIPFLRMLGSVMNVVR